MKKKIAAVTLSALLLALCVSANAQQAKKIPKIGFLRPGPPSQDVIDALRDGLRVYGYIEGKNIAVQYRWAAGGLDQLGKLATELVRLKPDVIVASSTPAALAVKNVNYHSRCVYRGWRSNRERVRRESREAGWQFHRSDQHGVRVGREKARATQRSGS